MECITVLKSTDGVLNKTGYWNQGLNQCVFENLQNERSNRFRRFCSHFRHNKAIWILMVFVLILFILLLLMFVQIQTLHKELKNFKQTTDDRLKHSENNIASLNSWKEHRIEHHLRHCQKELTQSRKRTARHESPSTRNPHFFLRGGGNGIQNDGIDQDGTFLWNKGNRQFDSDDNDFIAETNGVRVKKLRIQHPGVYYIFSEIAVKGRVINTSGGEWNSPYSPSVGYTLFKNNNSFGSELQSTFLTQDRRGYKYPSPGTAGYPVDTIQLYGLFTLERGDIIFIQRLRDQINDRVTHYMNEETHASFGGFLVERFAST